METLNKYRGMRGKEIEREVAPESLLSRLRMLGGTRTRDTLIEAGGKSGESVSIEHYI